MIVKTINHIREKAEEAREKIENIFDKDEKQVEEIKTEENK